jgi:hypothetical protein
LKFSLMKMMSARAETKAEEDAASTTPAKMLSMPPVRAPRTYRGLFVDAGLELWKRRRSLSRARNGEHEVVEWSVRRRNKSHAGTAQTAKQHGPRLQPAENG